MPDLQDTIMDYIGPSGGLREYAQKQERGRQAERNHATRHWEQTGPRTWERYDDVKLRYIGPSSGGKRHTPTGTREASGPCATLATCRTSSTPSTPSCGPCPSPPDWTW